MAAAEAAEGLSANAAVMRASTRLGVRRSADSVGLLAAEGQAHAGDDVVLGVLFFSGIVDQHAMDQPPREVAAVIPNLVAVVAGNREEAWCHSPVLDAGRRVLLREKGGG